MTTERDQRILDYGIWGMDDSDYRVLRNRMIVTRLPATCAICLTPIPPKSRVRASTEVCDGKCMTFKICPSCCEVCADDPDGEGMSARYALGEQTARQKETI